MIQNSTQTMLVFAGMLFSLLILDSDATAQGIQAQDTQTKSTILTKPLVLQLEVSHSRNTDQISLVFRKNTVELVVNTSHYQKDSDKAFLGWFTSPITPELKEWKKRIKLFYKQSQQTVSILAFIKDQRFQPEITPHSPVFRINEEEIQTSHPYFESLANIIQQIWDIPWTCVDCATYQKSNSFIIRTVRVRTSKPGLNDKSKQGIPTHLDQWKVIKQKWATSLLNCVPKGKRKIECIDPQFGIFEI